MRVQWISSAGKASPADPRAQNRSRQQAFFGVTTTSVDPGPKGYASSASVGTKPPL